MLANRQILKNITALTLIITLLTQNALWADPTIKATHAGHDNLQIPSLFHSEERILELTMKYLVQVIPDKVGGIENYNHYLPLEVTGVKLELDFHRKFPYHDEYLGECVVVPCYTVSDKRNKHYAVIGPDRSVIILTDLDDIAKYHPSEPTEPASTQNNIVDSQMTSTETVPTPAAPNTVPKKTKGRRLILSGLALLMIGASRGPTDWICPMLGLTLIFFGIFSIAGHRTRGYRPSRFTVMSDPSEELRGMHRLLDAITKGKYWKGTIIRESFQWRNIILNRLRNHDETAEVPILDADKSTIDNYENYIRAVDLLRKCVTLDPKRHYRLFKMLEHFRVPKEAGNAVKPPGPIGLDKFYFILFYLEIATSRVWEELLESKLKEIFPNRRVKKYRETIKRALSKLLSRGRIRDYTAYDNLTSELNAAIEIDDDLNKIVYFFESQSKAKRLPYYINESVNKPHVIMMTLGFVGLDEFNRWLNQAVEERDYKKTVFIINNAQFLIDNFPRRAGTVGQMAKFEALKDRATESILKDQELIRVLTSDIQQGIDRHNILRNSMKNWLKKLESLIKKAESTQRKEPLAVASMRWLCKESYALLAQIELRFAISHESHLYLDSIFPPMSMSPNHDFWNKGKIRNFNKLSRDIPKLRKRLLTFTRKYKIFSYKEQAGAEHPKTREYEKRKKIWNALISQVAETTHWNSLKPADLTAINGYNVKRAVKLCGGIPGQAEFRGTVWLAHIAARISYDRGVINPPFMRDDNIRSKEDDKTVSEAYTDLRTSIIPELSKYLDELDGICETELNHLREQCALYQTPIHESMLLEARLSTKLRYEKRKVTQLLDKAERLIEKDPKPEEDEPAIDLDHVGKRAAGIIRRMSSLPTRSDRMNAEAVKLARLFMRYPDKTRQACNDILGNGMVTPEEHKRLLPIVRAAIRTTELQMDLDRAANASSPTGMISLFWEPLIESGWISRTWAARISFVVEEIVFAGLIINLANWIPTLFGFETVFAVKQLLSASAVLYGLLHWKIYKWRISDAEDDDVEKDGDKPKKTFEVKEVGDARLRDMLGFAILGALFRLGYLFPQIGPWWPLFTAFAAHALYNNVIARYLKFLPVGMAGKPDRPKADPTHPTPDPKNNEFTRNYEIVKRSDDDGLVPVITVPESMLQQSIADARARLLTVTRQDYDADVFMPVLLGSLDEMQLTNALINFNERTASNDPAFRHRLLIKSAYKAIRMLEYESLEFLKMKVSQICGREAFDEWSYLEDATSEDLLVELADRAGTLFFIQLADFSSLLCSLTLFYGGNLARRSAVFELNDIKRKYGDSPLSKKVSIIDKILVTSLGFSFLGEFERESGQRTVNSEYKEILRVMKSVNKDTLPQVKLEARMWARDMIAWLDYDHRDYVRGITLQHRDAAEQAASGKISEGGCVIPGVADSKFVLTTEHINDDVQRAFKRHAAQRGITAYTLPAGFFWIKTSDYIPDEMDTDGVPVGLALQDTGHIDGVINFIPSQFTKDNKARVLVDPFYFDMIKGHAEFNSFLSEQGLSIEENVVVVDKKEAYLNLPNFATVIGDNDKPRLLFNKDLGYTLPRLNLKEGLLIQPEHEVTLLSAAGGGIRCLTNMFPKDMVIRERPLNIRLDILPFFDDAEKAVIEHLRRRKHLLAELSSVSLSAIGILYMPLYRSAFECHTPHSQACTIIFGNDLAINPEELCLALDEALIAVIDKIETVTGMVRNPQSSLATPVIIHTKSGTVEISLNESEEMNASGGLAVYAKILHDRYAVPGTLPVSVINLSFKKELIGEWIRIAIEDSVEEMDKEVDGYITSQVSHLLGNHEETLETIKKDIREVFEIERYIKSHTADGQVAVYDRKGNQVVRRMNPDDFRRSALMKVGIAPKSVAGETRWVDAPESGGTAYPGNSANNAVDEAQKRRLVRDLSNNEELGTNLGEKIVKAMLSGRRLVLVFDNELGKISTVSPLKLVRKLKCLKADPRYKSLLDNLIIKESSIDKLHNKLYGYVDDNTDIMLFWMQPVKNTREALILRKFGRLKGVRRFYINEEELPYSARYPIAEIITLAMVTHLERVTVEQIVEDLKEQGIALKDLNILDMRTTPTGTVIINLLPDAIEEDKEKLLKDYSETIKFLISA